jgi:hypothetical protein
MVTKRMVLERDRALKLENTNKISIGITIYGTCVGVPFSQLIVEPLPQVKHFQCGLDMMFHLGYKAKIC